MDSTSQEMCTWFTFKICVNVYLISTYQFYLYASRLFSLNGDTYQFYLCAPGLFFIRVIFSSNLLALEQLYDLHSASKTDLKSISKLV